MDLMALGNWVVLNWILCFWLKLMEAQAENFDLMCKVTIWSPSPKGMRS